MTNIAIKRSKQEIISSHCYTDLVYDRIRKKLSITSSNSDIESLILGCLQKTDDKTILFKAKIYTYITIKIAYELLQQQHVSSDYC